MLGPEQRDWLFAGLREGEGRHQWRLPERVQTNWLFLASATNSHPRTDPDAAESVGASWKSDAGSRELSPAAAYARRPGGRALSVGAG